MIHLYFGDNHCLPEQNNDRAEWLAKLALDLKPDVIICGGDSADMSSLCSYDRGTKNFIGRNYKKDIEAHLDFTDRLMTPLRKTKKKLPRRVFIEGNHENRIKRAIQYQPELEGAISFKDLCIGDYYDECIEYTRGTPGIVTIDGVTYAHYFVTGVSGKPTSSSAPAGLSLSKSLGSITQGHSHVLDYATRPTVLGNRLHSLVGGCFMTERLEWAGTVNELWWSGCFIKREVSAGNYDLEMVSIERLKKEYS